jgi:hypothetical protein
MKNISNVFWYLGFIGTHDDIGSIFGFLILFKKQSFKASF